VAAASFSITLTASAGSEDGIGKSGLFQVHCDSAKFATLGEPAGTFRQAKATAGEWIGEAGRSHQQSGNAVEAFGVALRTEGAAGMVC
jgi:hypothetical protein